MNKFTSLLKENNNAKNNQIINNNVKKVIIQESNQETPEELLRRAKLKIKMVTPTSFGTQIDFAKNYDADEIEELLKDFTIKIKNKSVFIVD